MSEWKLHSFVCGTSIASINLLRCPLFLHDVTFEGTQENMGAKCEQLTFMSGVSFNYDAVSCRNNDLS